MTVLRHEKEAAIAEAEVRVLQEEEGGFETRWELPSEEEDAPNRTKQYVENHAGNVGDIYLTNQEGDNRNNMNLPNQPDNNEHSAVIPPNTHNTHEPNSASPTEHFTRFLLTKDLLLTRLRTFSDKPEEYGIWKSGLQSIMRELDAVPEEELDFLSRRLGRESGRCVNSIRDSNVHNQRRGLERIWERLDERYGCPEFIEASVKKKNDFPKLSNKDVKQLYELVDLLCEVESLKEDHRYSTLLSYFDASLGINLIVKKLPYNLQEKWTNQAFRYKESHHVTYPPFSFFVKFIRDISKIRNDPSFVYDTDPTLRTRDKPSSIPPAGRFNIRSKTTVAVKVTCPFHLTNHALNDCNGFKHKKYAEKKEFLKSKGYCFKCATTNEHVAKECPETVMCGKCSSNRHPKFLHTDYNDRFQHSNSSSASNEYGGEETSKRNLVLARCTQVCGNANIFGKSCSKPLLADVCHRDNPSRAIKAYVVIDDQSNASLARTELFDHLNIQGLGITYTLSSCAGTIESSGRRASGIIIESLDKSSKLELSSVIECNEIPNAREEIATPDVTANYNHLKDISADIPLLDSDAEIILLVGRDLVEAHHVLDQRIGPRSTPYAQKLPLRWVIIGETCLGRSHVPNTVSVKKTCMWSDGRSSIFEPCGNNLQLQETGHNQVIITDAKMSAIFHRSKEDDEIGLSVQDREFLKIDGSGNVQGT